MNQISKQSFRNCLENVIKAKILKLNHVQGNEGTKIKQYFHPHNTLNGINYSHSAIYSRTRKKI